MVGSQLIIILHVVCLIPVLRNVKLHERCLIMVNKERPYFRFSYYKLNDLAKECWEDYQTLYKIYTELLLHRSTPYAFKLRARIVDRLNEIVNQGFPWPQTEAEKGGGELEIAADWLEVGLLSFIGYKVGQKGLDELERHTILAFIYKEQLPLVNSIEYMAEWGVPESGHRLKKIAESIAAFIRNTKRKKVKSYQQAIFDWKNDLEYLRQSYYVGRYDFYWPSTDIT